MVLFGPSPGGAPQFPYVDKAVHVALFALVTAAAAWRFGAVRGVLVGAVAYAAGSEAVQGLLLPGRQADPADVLADLVGVLGVWLPARRRRNPSNP